MSLLENLKTLAIKHSNDQDFGEAVRELLFEKRIGFPVTTFDDYTVFVKSMKAYPEKHAIVYPIIGLADEAGECAGKVKKWLRGDSDGVLDVPALMKELGDPLWYIASAADDLGFTLQDVVNINVDKLSSRKERGVLKGDGDNR